MSAHAHAADATAGIPGLHGVMAEYRTAQELLEAAKRVHAAGYRAVDAFTPFPIEELSEVVCDHHKSKVPLICFAGGAAGALGGWALATWTSVVAYPMNIGGKPYYSWPAWIPIFFECMVLVASFSAGLGMLALNGLPQPYHPVFNVERFRAKASRDGFFLVIESTDPKFDRAESARFLEASGAAGVWEVEE
jgi:hypothetical protein